MGYDARACRIDNQDKMSRLLCQEGPRLVGVGRSFSHALRVLRFKNMSVFFLHFCKQVSLPDGDLRRISFVPAGTGSGGGRQPTFE